MMYQTWLKSWYLFWWWLRRGTNWSVTYAQFSDSRDFTSSSKYTDTDTVLFPTMFHDFVFCAFESWKAGLGNTIRVLSMWMISFEIRWLVLRGVAHNVSLRYHNVWGWELELDIEAGSQMRKVFFFPVWHHFFYEVYSVVGFMVPKLHGFNKY